MNPSNKLLSDIIAYRTYARYLPHAEKRETIEQSINRSLDMHIKKFGGLGKGLSGDIIKDFEKKKKI